MKKGIIEIKIVGYLLIIAIVLLALFMITQELGEKISALKNILGY